MNSYDSGGRQLLIADIRLGNHACGQLEECLPRDAVRIQHRRNSLVTTFTDALHHRNLP